MPVPAQIWAVLAQMWMVAMCRGRAFGGWPMYAEDEDYSDEYACAPLLDRPDRSGNCARCSPRWLWVVGVMGRCAVGLGCKQNVGGHCGPRGAESSLYAPEGVRSTAGRGMVRSTVRAVTSRTTVRTLPCTSSRACSVRASLGTRAGVATGQDRRAVTARSGRGVFVAVQVYL
jgi:hypothetical protein